jgi:hypothetical protein
MDVKFPLAAARDVQGKVYRIVQKRGAIHIPDSRGVDSVRKV